MSHDRIRKLLGMTVGNGCTEAEAMAAAGKAAQLMEELGLRREDLEIGQEDHPIAAGWGSARGDLWATIAACTNSAPIVRWAAGRQVLTYVGREPGPQIAAYLHEVTGRAIDRHLRTFKTTAWYKRRRTLRAKRAAADDFVLGMARRMSVRLLQLFATQRSMALLEGAKAERDRRFGGETVPGRTREVRYHEARVIGAIAGGAVPLSQGIAVDEAPMQIEGTR